MAAGATLPPTPPAPAAAAAGSAGARHPRHSLPTPAAPRCWPLLLLALAACAPPTTVVAVASVTLDRSANVIARSDFATTGSLVPPPADSGAVKFKLVTGGGEREAPDPSAIAAAVARGAGVPAANVTATRLDDPPGCAAYCGTWDVVVAVGDPAAAATLRVSLDAGAQRSILRRALVATGAAAASYNYSDGLLPDDRAADVVTEMGGAGGLSGGAVAGVVLGAVAGVALLAAATTLLAVRLRRRGYVGGRGCGTSGGESGKAEGEGA